MSELQVGSSYSNDKCHVLTVVSVEADSVVCYPQGGGLQMTIPREKFAEQFSLWEPRVASPALVTTDGFGAGVSFKAYALDGRWNGWVIPYFPKEEGMRMVPLVDGLRFDESMDAFVYLDPYAGEYADLEVFEAESMQTSDGVQTLYGIGACYWTWEKARIQLAEVPT